MKYVARFIEQRLRLRYFLPLLIATVATTWIGLFWSVNRFKRLSKGLSFLDMQPRLDADSLFEQITSYSQETVNFYLGWSLFDYAWPFITFTTMLFISAWLFRYLSPRAQQWFVALVTSAYATVLLDWLENLGFVALVMGLPAEPLWLAYLSLGLHMGKLFFNLVFNLGFWFLLLAAATARLRARRKAQL